MQGKLNSHILHRSRRSHPEVTIESGKTQCNKKKSEQREYYRDSHSRLQDVLTGSSSSNSPPQASGRYVEEKAE